MIYGRCSVIYIPHFVPIGQTTWPPKTIQICEWRKDKKISESTWSIGPNLFSNNKWGWGLLQKKIVPIGPNTWSVEEIQVSNRKRKKYLKLLRNLEPDFERMVWGRRSTKIYYFVKIGQRPCWQRKFNVWSVKYLSEKKNLFTIWSQVLPDCRKRFQMNPIVFLVDSKTSSNNVLGENRL